MKCAKYFFKLSAISILIFFCYILMFSFKNKSVAVIADQENEVSAKIREKSIEPLDVYDPRRKKISECISESLNKKSLAQLNIQPEKYDVKKLVNYNGISTKIDSPITNSVNIGCWMFKSNTVMTVDRLLSSQKIRYISLKAGGGWSSPEVVYVIVPKDKCEEAVSVLKGATDTGLIEKPDYSKYDKEPSRTSVIYPDGRKVIITETRKVQEKE